jgi:hypothetical protein
VKKAKGKQGGGAHLIISGGGAAKVMGMPPGCASGVIGESRFAASWDALPSSRGLPGYSGWGMEVEAVCAWLRVNSERYDF